MCPSFPVFTDATREKNPCESDPIFKRDISFPKGHNSAIAVVVIRMMNLWSDLLESPKTFPPTFQIWGPLVFPDRELRPNPRPKKAGTIISILAHV